MLFRPATKRWFRVAVSIAAVSLTACGLERLGPSFGELGILFETADGQVRIGREGVIDFGPVFTGEIGRATLSVTNLGSGSLTLQDLTSVAGAGSSVGDESDPAKPFHVEFEPGRVLLASEQVDVALSFIPGEPTAPEATTEDFSSELRLTTSGTRPNEGTGSVTLRATAVFGSCYLPGQLDFGRVARGHESTVAVAFDNRGPVPTRAWVGDTTSDSGDHWAFVQTESSPSGELDVAPASTLAVAWEFRPTESRRYHATVQLRRGIGCPARTVVLSGEGVEPLLTWAPAVLDFGYVPLGQGKTAVLRLDNHSDREVAVGQLQAGLPEDYRVSSPESTLDLHLSAGGTATLVVTCTPSVLGPRSSRVTFTSSLPEQQQGRIPLECFGGGPDIAVKPSPVLNFGRVPFFPEAPAAQTRKLTVLNVGTRTPDSRGFLRLGVGDGTPPFAEARWLGNEPDELEVSVSASYPPSGLPAEVGKNAAELAVRLGPRALGRKEGRVTIHSNDLDEPQVVVSVVADVVALPPCQWAVSPAQLNFGIVTPGEFKDLPIRITNTGTQPDEVCVLFEPAVTGGELAGAFMLLGGDLGSRELPPGTSTSLTVRAFALTAPAMPQPISGELSLHFSSPTHPVASVPLAATISSACLVAVPNHVAFGTVKKGCSSSSRSLALYNVCTTRLTVNALGMGVTNCTGGALCQEFSVVGASGQVLGATLNPGDPPLRLSLTYQPTNEGQDDAVLTLDANAGSSTVTQAVTLGGQGDLEGLNTDVFEQRLTSKSDVLFVVDNSCSMEPHQASLASNFQSFILHAQSSGVDYHLAVTTTDDEETLNGSTSANPNPFLPAISELESGTAIGGERGRFLFSPGNPTVLTADMPGAEELFKAKVRVGTKGSGAETCLAPALKALTPPLTYNTNAGFLRLDANLSVICVTDAPDQSSGTADFFVSSFARIKGLNHADLFTFNAIAGFSPNPTCPYDPGPDTGKYAEVVARTGGLKEDICTPNWAHALDLLGKAAAGLRTRFTLTSAPDLAIGNGVSVRVDGVEVPPTDSQGNNVWSFEPSTSTVVFEDGAAPAPGSTVTVTYHVACL